MATAPVQNRLSTADRDAFIPAMFDMLEEWRTRSTGRNVTAGMVSAPARETLLRRAYASIGCVEADLRDVELDEVRIACDTLVASFIAATGSTPLHLTVCQFGDDDYRYKVSYRTARGEDHRFISG